MLLVEPPQRVGANLAVEVVLEQLRPLCDAVRGHAFTISSDSSTAFTSSLMHRKCLGFFAFTSESTLFPLIAN